MRNPLNNPTDRILRLLSEYDDLKAAYADLLELAVEYFPTQRLQALAVPIHTEFEKELQRQGGNYTRLRASVISKRAAAQRTRLIKKGDETQSSAVPDLSVDEINKMIKDIE